MGRIAIVSAMHQELAALLRRMPDEALALEREGAALRDFAV